LKIDILFRSTQTQCKGREVYENKEIQSQSCLGNHFPFKQLTCWHQPYVIYTKKAEDNFFHKMHNLILQALSNIQRSSLEVSNTESGTLC